MDLRWIIIGGLLSYGAYKAFVKPGAKDDEETAAKRLKLLSQGIDVTKLTPTEVKVVWDFKYYEGMGNFTEADRYLIAVKKIAAKYNIVI